MDPDQDLSGGGGRLGCRVRDGVAWIEIDNPGKRNAMTGRMWRTLPPLLDGLAADPTVHAVVLTGRGDTFCAGADISELTTMRDTAGAAGQAVGDPGAAGQAVGDPGAAGQAVGDRGTGAPVPGENAAARSHAGEREDVVLLAEAALFAFPKPTVAVIDGFCIGGGCQLAVGCDLRFATDRARFAITPAKLGIVYPASSLARLTALVGPAAAKLLLFSADLIDARHARRVGLVDEVHPVDRLPERVRDFTATLATRSQLTLHAAKDVIDAAAAGLSLTGRARHWEDQARASGEAAEGIAAYLQRRTPQFPWRPGAG